MSRGELQPGRLLSVYPRLLRYATPHWRVFAVAIAAMAVYAATDTGFAALMQPMLDGSFVERDPTVIRLIPVALVALFLVRGLTGFTSTYGMGWIGRRVIHTLRGEMFDHMLRLPAAYYDATTSGRLLSRLTYNTEQVAEATTNAVTVIVRDTLTVVFLLGWMFWINGWLALLFLIVAPAIAALVRYVSRRFRRISTRIQDSMGDVTQTAEEVINGQRVVKTFGGEARERAAFGRINDNNRRLHMKMTVTRGASVPVVQLIVACTLALVVWLATLEPMLEQLTVGSFVSFITAMLLLLPPVKRLTGVTAQLQKGVAAAESIFALLDSETETDTGTRSLQRAAGRIEYDAVDFRYPGEAGEVLSDVSFAVAPGETVALVGRSGSGKSTLVSLLPRFYDPTRGAVRLDGVDLREYRLADLRAQIALVSQEVVLFNDTVAGNIAYGAMAGAARADIEAAAEAAHAMDFIRRLPQGLDTPVGENGALLSGGQRQRLAIARALLKDAPILILDEATSSLDSESESHIHAALETLMRGRTTLVIAHRLSTVEAADRILVLDEGRVIETGTHAELLARNGAYAALHRLQFREASAS